MIDFQHYKSILCLDGDLPEASFFNRSLPIIAADGAANKLVAMGITPHIVIGDLDSILPENKNKLKLHHHYDQNYCDFQKSLFFMEENKLLPAIIVGINGGILDHVLNNVNIFINTNSLLYAPPLYGFTVNENTTKVFNVPFDTKISLLGIPSARVSTKGFKWELDQKWLSFPGENSCFNQSMSENLTVTVHEGKVLILVYQD